MNNNSKREALLVFLLFLFCYVYFHHDPGWNGNSRLDLTFAFVEEGRMTIDSFHNQEDTYTKDKAIYQGHYYSTKAIGSSLTAVFFYYPMYQLEQLFNFKLSIGLIKYILTFFSIGLPSALACSLMYMLCKQVTGNTLRSYIFTITISLGTMIFPYSAVFYGHQLAGALLFGAFFLIFQIKVDPSYRHKSIFFLVGFLLGYALITEYPVALIVLILTTYYLLILSKIDGTNRTLIVLLPALGACIPMAVALAYNTAVFGSPVSIGYTYSAVPYFQEQQTQGLVGIGWPNIKVMFFMTMHPAFGIFWQSPVLIMSLIGIWFMWQVSKYRIEALVSFAAFCSLLILYSGFYNWWGGWTFGPRYIIPMLPFLCLPLVFLPVRWFASIVILGVVSVIQMFIVVSSLILTPDSYYAQIEKLGFFEYSPIYSYCLRLLLSGDFSKNLGNQLLNLHGWTSLTPLLIIIVGLSLFFFKESRYTSIAKVK